MKNLVKHLSGFSYTPAENKAKKLHIKHAEIIICTCSLPLHVHSHQNCKLCR